MSHLVESAISKDKKIKNLELKVENLVKEIQQIKRRLTSLEKKGGVHVPQGAGSGNTSDDQDCLIS